MTTREHAGGHAGVITVKLPNEARAEPLCREALDMRRALYPKDKYPNAIPTSP